MTRGEWLDQFAVRLREGEILAGKKGRDFIEGALEVLWEAHVWFDGTPAIWRELLEKASGRILLTHHDVEHLFRRYSDWDHSLRCSMPIHHDLVLPIYYGEQWKQQWFLLRDVVIATQKARRLIRANNSVCICGKRFDRWDRCEWRDYTHEDKFFRLPKRFFRERDWNIQIREYRQDQALDSTSAFKIRCGVCSVECEVKRFARWRKLKDQELSKWLKEQERNRKESEWIRKGKALLKQTRTMLRQNRSSSPPKASTPESISLDSWPR